MPIRRASTSRTRRQRGAGTGAPLHRLEIDPAEVDLGAFRLDHDLALGERRVGAFVHELAVDEVLQPVAGHDRLDVGPLESRALDVLRAAGPALVGPVLAGAPPVDAAAVEHLRLAVGVEDVLAVAILAALDG